MRNVVYSTPLAERVIFLRDTDLETKGFVESNMYFKYKSDWKRLILTTDCSFDSNRNYVITLNIFYKNIH